MADIPTNRWTRIAINHPEIVGGGVAAIGVIAIWQDILPKGISMGLLLGGIGIYAAGDWLADHLEDADAENDQETEPKPEPDPEPEHDPERVLEGSRDLGEFDVPEGEAPWWDTKAYPTTQERIEAMKRQDPDYTEDDEDGDDESILDKFARVLGLDEESTDDEAGDDDERKGLLDGLDPLFDEAGSLEADMEDEGGLEAELESEMEMEMEAELDFEEELEVDLEDERR